MMKNYIILLMLFPMLVFSQVGIYTTNPQEVLHVSGSTPNVKIDGLNEINNAKI